MYCAHIYLKDSHRWTYPTIAAANWSETLNIAEAIALCHGANVDRPGTAVFCLAEIT
jgi:hypothetical protein